MKRLAASAFAALLLAGCASTATPNAPTNSSSLDLVVKYNHWNGWEMADPNTPREPDPEPLVLENAAVGDTLGLPSNAGKDNVLTVTEVTEDSVSFKFSRALSPKNDDGGISLREQVKKDKVTVDQPKGFATSTTDVGTSYTISLE